MAGFELHIADRGSAVRVTRKSCLFVAAVAFAVLGGTSIPAAATGAGNPSPPPGGTSSTGGSVSGDQLLANAGFHKVAGTTLAPNGNPVSVVHENFIPAACWWAPKWDPTELNAYAHNMWSSPSIGGDFLSRMYDHYQYNVGPGSYKDWNVANTGKGKWWQMVYNDAMMGTPQMDACLNQLPTWPWFWVDFGQPVPPPPVGKLPTAQDIADVAANAVEVPKLQVEMSPAQNQNQTVNLPTWIYLPKTTLAPVWVEACVQYYNTPCATVTATATEVDISSGAPAGQAVLYPSNGQCKLNGDGSLGAKYVPGDGTKDPPCGVRYLAPTPNGTTYPLTATVQWTVTFVGTGMPNPTQLKQIGLTGQPQPVTVQEIQTIVSGNPQH